MGTVAARRFLDENLKQRVSPTKEPAMYNLCQALREITLALDSLEFDLSKVKKKIGA